MFALRALPRDDGGERNLFTTRKVMMQGLGKPVTVIDQGGEANTQISIGYLVKYNTTRHFSDGTPKFRNCGKNYIYCKYVVSKTIPSINVAVVEQHNCFG